MLEQCEPAGIQVHQLPAHRQSFENETAQAVPIVHGGAGRDQPPSFFFNSSFSCAGFALPAVAFITWPTKKPNSLSLPAR